MPSYPLLPFFPAPPFSPKTSLFISLSQRNPSITRLNQARTTALNSLHLRLAEQCPPEPLRQLIAVPELALLRLHAAELAARAASHGACGLRTRAAAAAATTAAAHHRTMLVGLLPVLGEGLGQGFGWRGRVDLGSVVDFWTGDEVSGSVSLLTGGAWEAKGLRLGTERRPRNLIRGVCLKRTLVARIFAVLVVVKVEEPISSGEILRRGRGSWGFLLFSRESARRARRGDFELEYVGAQEWEKAGAGVQ